MIEKELPVVVTFEFLMAVLQNTQAFTGTLRLLRRRRQYD